VEPSATHRAIDGVWRIESGRRVAGLTRVVRDVSVAEDLAQDALVAALQQWPREGIPTNPGAWLIATAKRRGIDALRRRVTLERKQELIGRELQIVQQLDQPDLMAQVDDVQDDVLRLVFMTCHPVLSRDARVALTLRLLGGLSTPEIARAFLVSEGTITQRIVRAKRTLTQARVPFEVPGRDELGSRLAAVLEVIYLVFNEGYAATAGEHWVRPALCQDALRLGRVLAALMPREAEVHGLLALMELQASRLRARVGAHGEPVLLADQDRARWDHLLVQRGLAELHAAEQLGGALGPYALQGAIAGCHARARSVEETDWPRIVALYDGLAALTGSPVVELNRAVAVTMAFGPEAGMELVDALADEPALRGYHRLPSVRGDLLVRLGRHDEAREEFLRRRSLRQRLRARAAPLARSKLQRVSRACHARGTPARERGGVSPPAKADPRSGGRANRPSCPDRPIRRISLRRVSVSCGLVRRVSRRPQPLRNHSEDNMRKLILHMIISTDGFVSTEDGNVNPAAHWSEEIQRHYTDLFDRAGGVVFGRNLYEQYVGHYSKVAAGEISAETDLAPEDADNEHFVASHLAWTKRLMDMDKFVVSNSLPPTTPAIGVISGDIAAQIQQLKQQDGGDLLLMCGPSLFAVLNASQLIDEYMFYVYPNALGRGKHLYRDVAAPISLTPERSVPFADGMELREYTPEYAA
jgi:RNA polymerase sigma factor (sigma-70 family)